MSNEGRQDLPPLREIPCPLCGETVFRIAHFVRDRLQKAEAPPQEEKYRIVACASCGFLYLNPRPAPEDLIRYYAPANYDPHRRRGGGWTGWLYRHVRPFSVNWKARQVARGLPSSGKLLDVGCGSGEFLRAMQRRGWQVLGIEKDSAAAQQAQSPDCPVLVGDPAQVTLPADEFDLVTFWHSLEHLPDLEGALRKVAASLKTGGSLAIALPNPESLDARFYASRWVAWDAPRHLYHFRRKDLQTLLERHGMRYLRSRALPLDPFYHALLSELSWVKGAAVLPHALRGLLLGSCSFLYAQMTGVGSSLLYQFIKHT